MAIKNRRFMHKSHKIQTCQEDSWIMDQQQQNIRTFIFIKEGKRGLYMIGTTLVYRIYKLKTN